MNHIDLKKIMQKFGMVSPNDYIRAVNYETNAYTDLYLNKINNIVNENSKYILVLNVPNQEDPVVLHNPNLQDKLHEINERLISGNLSSAYDNKRDRFPLHFEKEMRLRIGNKSSDFMYIDLFESDLVNLNKKKNYFLASHVDIQAQLLILGLSLGYDVKVANTDFNKKSSLFNELTLGKISNININDLKIKFVSQESRNEIDRIDVIWFDNFTNRVVASFEVELSRNYQKSFLKLAELTKYCPKYSQEIYSIIVGSKNLFNTVSNKTNTISSTLLFGSNEIYYLTKQNLREMLYVKDQIGHGNYQDTQRDTFFNRKLITINNKILPLL